MWRQITCKKVAFPVGLLELFEVLGGGGRVGCVGVWGTLRSLTKLAAEYGDTLLLCSFKSSSILLQPSS